MNKKLVGIVFVALTLTGCATMTPEEKEAFARNMALGMQAAAQAQPKTTNCVSNKIGSTVYTTCQ